MVVLYLVYVAVVTGGNWWMSRRRGKRLALPDTDINRNGAPRDYPTNFVDENGSMEDADSDGGNSELGPQILSKLSQEADQNKRPSLTPLDVPAALMRPRSRASSLSSDCSHHHRSASTLRVATARNVSTALRASPRMNAEDRRVTDSSRPAFSLLGAIEFRDTINSLREESAAADELAQRWKEPTSPDYIGPITPFPVGHFRAVSQSGVQRRPSLRTSTSSRSVAGVNGEMVPTDPQTHSGARAHRPKMASNLSRASMGSRSKSAHDLRTPPSATDFARRPIVGQHDHASAVQPGSGFRFPQDPVPLGAGVEDPGSSTQPQQESADFSELLSQRLSAHQARHQSVPSINIITDDNQVVEPTLVDGHHEGYPLLTAEEYLQPRIRKRDRLWSGIHATLRILFPALQGFKHKSFFGKLVGVFASPAILALTITLPVVDDEAEGCTLHRGGIVLPESDADAELGETNALTGTTIQGDAKPSPIPQHHHTIGSELHHLVVDGGLPSPTVHASGDHAHHNHHGQHPGGSSTPRSDMVNDARSERLCKTETHSQCSDDAHALLFNKYLTAAQCIFGTLFCSIVFFGKSTRLLM